MSARDIRWRIGADVHAVRIEESVDGCHLVLDDRRVDFTVIERHTSGGSLRIDGRNHHFFVLRRGSVTTLWLDGTIHRLERVEKTVRQDGPVHASGEIRAAMPGKILRVDVGVGDTVEEKQTVVVMESMKMETVLHAPAAGRVSAVHVTPGQTVDLGDLLAVIE